MMKSKKYYILYRVCLLLGLLLLLILPIFYSKDIPAQNLREEYLGISFIGILIVVLLIHLFYRLNKQDYTLSINIFTILTGIMFLLNTSLFIKQTKDSYNLRNNLNQPNNILKYYQFRVLYLEIIFILIFLYILFILFYLIFKKIKNR